MSSFPMLFLEETVLSHCMLLASLWKISWLPVCGFISRLSTLFHWSIHLSLYQYHTILITVEYFEIKKYDAFSYGFFPQNLFSIQIFCGTIWILGFFFLFPLLKSHWSYFQIAQNNGSTQLLFCPVSQQTRCELDTVVVRIPWLQLAAFKLRFTELGSFRSSPWSFKPEWLHERTICLGNCCS